MNEPDRRDHILVTDTPVAHIEGLCSQSQDTCRGEFLSLDGEAVGTPPSNPSILAPLQQPGHVEFEWHTPSSKKALLHEDSAEISPGTSVIPVRTHSTGLVTHAYQRALAHRLKYDILLPGQHFDVKEYIPVFIHDTLMLPGSLAQLTNQPSTLEVLDRLTPAVLPRFRIDTHPHSQEACLQKSTNTSNYAHGLLCFGLGATSRRLIRDHYAPVATQIETDVQFNVKVPVALLPSSGQWLSWRTQRRSVQAQVYIWNHVEDLGGVSEDGQAKQWSLETFLGGDNSQCDATEVVQHEDA